jgi:hypothetical protein
MQLCSEKNVTNLVYVRAYFDLFRNHPATA